MILRRKQRGLSFLLVLCMAVSLLGGVAVPAKAADGTTVRLRNVTSWSALKQGLEGQPATVETHYMIPAGTVLEADSTIVAGSAGNEIQAVLEGAGEIRLSDGFTGPLIDDTYAKITVSEQLQVDETAVMLSSELTPPVLTFETSGGSDIPAMTVEKGTRVALTQEPTRSGYLFDGWYIDSRLTIQVLSVVMDVDRTVYAGWRRPEAYTLTYDSCGGSVVPPVAVLEGTALPLDVQPTRSGYRFTGWYLDAALTQPADDVTLDGDRTIYAGWEPIQVYVLHYETNGGSAVAAEAAEEGSVIALDAKPTRSGYTFTGWYLDAALTEPCTQLRLEADCTVYAGWREIVRCTLTFDTGAGSPVAPVTAPLGDTVSLTERPTRELYAFSGWFSDAALTHRLTSVTLTGDTTVYAGWSRTGRILTFETGGGSSIDAIFAAAGTHVELDMVPVWPGHVFRGWYLDEAMRIKVLAVTINSDLTVYAKWEESVPATLTYETGGGTVIGSESYAAGTAVTLTAVPVRQGFAFIGWFLDAACTQRVEQVTLDGDRTVYAGWVEDIRTLTYETGGGTAIGPEPYVVGTTVALTAVPVRQGFAFIGWFLDAACTQQVEQVTLDGDRTVYAGWSDAVFTLTYDSAGGSAVESQSGGVGTVLSLSAVPVRQGFTFLGWYGGEDAAEQVTGVTLTENVTVYARWKATKPSSLVEDHVAYLVGYDDGTVRPRDQITRAEVATIFYRLLEDDVRSQYLTRANTFSDVGYTDWYNTAVSTLTAMGILTGRVDGAFDPKAPITRAEFATIASRFGEASYSGEDHFTDIASHWARTYINLAAERGWVRGDGDGTFRPNDQITRAEAVTLVNRLLDREPKSPEDLLQGMDTWSDNLDPSAWYYLAIQEAANSHTYRTQADGLHETWEALAETPDWSALESGRA